MLHTANAMSAVAIKTFFMFIFSLVYPLLLIFERDYFSKENYKGREIFGRTIPETENVNENNFELILSAT